MGKKKPTDGFEINLGNRDKRETNDVRVIRCFFVALTTGYALFVTGNPWCILGLMFL